MKLIHRECYSLYRKETRKYYLSLSIDFQPHAEIFEIDEDLLLEPDYNSSKYCDLVIEYINKEVSKVYELPGHVPGSLIIFSDNTFQYVSYNNDYSYNKCFVGNLLL